MSATGRTAKAGASKKNRRVGNSDSRGMRQLSAWDSVFLELDTPASPMSGGFLHIYAPYRNEDSATRFQRLMTLVESNLDQSPVLRRTIMHSPMDLDLPWFVDNCEVNLAHHVIRHTLPSPGNDEQLNALYAEIAARQMDLSRPLWEIHFIDGLNAVSGVPRNAFALFIKFHHAGVDGGSAAEITSLLHRTTPTRVRLRQKSRAESGSHYRAPTLMSSLSHTLGKYAGLSTALGREILQRVPAQGGKMVGGLLRSGHSPAPTTGKGLSVPRTIFNVDISPERTYSHLSLSLSQITQIRRICPGATVNDVFLTVVGSAMQKYLAFRHALPRRSLVTGLTIDIREDEDRGTGGNQFVLVRLPLGTDITDPIERMMQIVRNTAEAKAEFKSKKSKPRDGRKTDWQALVPEPLLLLLGGVNRAGFFPRIKPLVNMGTTNVPGPKEVLYLDGARLIDFNGAPPIFQGIGLVINATSYDKALRISVFACKEVVPDPEILKNFLAEAFEEVRQAAKAHRQAIRDKGPVPGKSSRL